MEITYESREEIFVCKWSFGLELRRKIRANNYVEVETLGKTEGERIECEEQDTRGRSWQE